MAAVHSRDTSLSVGLPTVVGDLDRNSAKRPSSGNARETLGARGCTHGSTFMSEEQWDAHLDPAS